MPSPGKQFYSNEFGDIEDYFATDYWLIDQYIGSPVYLWGGNDFNNLGNNSATPSSTPITTFAGGINWKLSSCSNSFQYHSAAIKTDGTLWTWGRNQSGQLGINNLSNRATPVTTFTGGNNWRTVSVGSQHMLAIKTDGTLWSCGTGNKTGSGSNTKSVPTRVGTANNWKQSETGREHSIAVKTDGTLWVWGDNTFSPLGTNNGASVGVPVTTFAGGTNWKQCAAGRDHCAAVKTDGTLWTWGLGSSDQLGNGTLNAATPVTTFAGGTNWKSVCCTYVNTAAIKTDGTLWVWGNNQYGQLGTNDVTNRFSPSTTIVGGTNWKQISGGVDHFAAIKTDGTLWTWGRNNTGQLGTNDNRNRSTPVTTFLGGTNWKNVSAGGYFTSAVQSGVGFAGLPEF